MAQNMAAPAPPQGLQPQNYLEYAVYCYLQVWGRCGSVDACVGGVALTTPPQGLQPHNYLEYAVYCYLQAWGKCGRVGNDGV